MIVCPYTAPPFETLAAVFVIMLVISRIAEWKPSPGTKRSSKGTAKNSRT